MGVRLDRYREKNKKKKKRIYTFIKSLGIIFLIICLLASIIYVNNTIKEFNYIDNTTLFRFDFEEGNFTFLGKNYRLKFDNIFRFRKPD